MTEQNERLKKTVPAWLKYVLKILFSGLALYFVFTKIDFNQTVKALSNLDMGYFLIGFALFIASQIISVFRLGFLCRAENIIIPFAYNLKLYFIGMAYNLFLPGGVGGDAYKAILFASRFKTKLKAVFRALLLDRLSGLLAIAILLVFLASLVALPGFWPYRHWYYTLSIAGLPFSWLILKKMSPRYLPFFSGTILLALLVQILQGMCILMLAFSLKGDIISYVEHYPMLLLVFFSSSVATAIPVFLGGLGAREAVFGGMAIWLGLDEQLMVETAILFSICTLAGSMPGIPLDWLGKRRKGAVVERVRRLEG